MSTGSASWAAHTAQYAYRVEEHAQKPLHFGSMIMDL
jgi:hypothetical protein